MKLHSSENSDTAATFARLAAGAVLTVMAAFPGATPAAANGSVEFTKAFLPSTIGPGSVSRLRFQIVNFESVPHAELAFTDTLPAGMAIANVPRPTTTCGAATLSAPAGGTTITFSDGSVAAMGSCLVGVNVTSATPGTHMNVSGTLTSDGGSHTSASADLVVTTNLPGFLKSFAPSTVQLGARSTMTLIIDNSANPSAVAALAFADNLPPGMTVAGPANAVTDCGTAPFAPTLVANPGSGVVTFSYSETASFPAVEAGAICTVTVDVKGNAVGTLGNVTGELLVDSELSAGRASAPLTVTADVLALSKSFTDDPVPPGGTVTLEFTLRNRDRLAAATSIDFTDDLDATLSGLTAIGTPVVGPCGPGSQLTGSSLLTLSGGSLAPGETCVFSVTLEVPVAAAAGAYPNTTSGVAADVGTTAIVGSPATETLFVVPAPLLTKEFVGDPVSPGTTVTLRFTIDAATSSAVTDIAFVDELTNATEADGSSTGGFLPFPVSVTLPPSPDPPCGSGSSLTLVGPTELGTDREGLSLTGGDLAGGGSCTFEVDLGIPLGMAGGTYVNTTRPITATVDGESVTGAPASDDIIIVAAPTLVKEFTDDPAQPGGTATLEFTLSHDADAEGDATGIGFTDDLDAALTGLASTSGTLNDVCGTGSQLSGTSELTLTGGTLMPGEQCIFSVNLQVPVTAPIGAHTNVTSEVSATVSGIAVQSPPASDDLRIAGLELTKSFTDDPVAPGDTVTLEFTITNLTTADTATGIYFEDDLDATLPGLAVDSASVPTTPCGAGSGITLFSADTFLTFSGGTLAPGASCTFSVVLDVPLGAVPDSYTNTTIDFSATMQAMSILFPNASDELVVSVEELEFGKEFTDDPVAPGDTVTLAFTIDNPSSVSTATGIAFTDDLNAVLAGLAAVGTPIADVCGAGSSLDGTSLLALTGGTLPPGGSCTFSATLQVPAGAAPADYSNTTSQLTATLGGESSTASPASDTLTLIGFLLLEKATNGDDADLPPGPSIPAGDPVTWTYVVMNQTGEALINVTVTDDQGVAVSCPQTTLAAGGSMTCTATGAAEQGQYANVGTASGSGSRVYTASDPSHYLGFHPLDFGDAGASHPTLLAANGARHRADAAFGLGAAVDTEGDGQPDATATGDDLAGIDDEDGVAFTATVVAGETAHLDVTARGGSGLLNAWLDLDGDGAWGAGEQIFTDEPLVAGVNSLAFPVPADAAAGLSFARFRLDTGGGLAPTGEALDGEVEDYNVEIVTRADLSVEKTQVFDELMAGRIQIYTVRVANAGPSRALDVSIEDTLAVDSLFVSTNPGLPTCSESGGVTTCDLDHLDPGEELLIELTAQIDPKAGGAAVNAVVVDSPTTDPDPANNEAIASATVHELADVIALGDANFNGTSEIAVLTRGSLLLQVFDGGTGELLVRRNLSGEFLPVAMTRLRHFADTPADEVAVLGERPGDGAVRVLVIDGRSWKLLKTLQFDGNYVPLGIASLPDQGESPADEIVVLARRRSDGVGLLTVKDAATAALLGRHWIPRPISPIALAGVDAGEIAALARRRSGGWSLARLVDAASGAIVSSVPFGAEFAPLGLGVLPNFAAGAASELAVLALHPGDGRIRSTVRDSGDATLIGHLSFGSTLLPVEQTVLPDFGAGPAAEVGLARRSTDDATLDVRLRDAGGASLGSLVVPGGRHPLAMAFVPDYADSTAPEVALLLENGGLVLEVRDAATGALLLSVPVP